MEARDFIPYEARDYFSKVLFENLGPVAFLDVQGIQSNLDHLETLILTNVVFALRD
jgi:hypothetical protein